MRDGQHLFQLVCDKDDAHPTRSEIAHHLEQFLHFLGCEHGSRLIQNEDIGVTIQCLDNFDALLHPHREFLNQRIGVNCQAVLLAQFPHPPRCLVHIQQHATGDLFPQYHIFCNAHHGNQLEMLMHHTDPAVNGLTRADKMHLFAIKLNRA